MKTDESDKSARLAMWYRDTPLSLEMMKTLEGEVTSECWRYLFGKYTLSEKKKRPEGEPVNETYGRIGEEFDYLYTNMKDYIDYAHAIDRIYALLPHVAEDILNGKSRIGQKATVLFGRLNFREMSEVLMRLSRENTPVKLIIAEQKALSRKTKRPGRPKLNNNETPRASVKDIPVYNPDAQINALAYTIPSWVNMVERTFSVSDFALISHGSRFRLAEELKRLIDSTSTMMSLIMEEI